MKKILIIEDNELNMELLSDLLEFHGYKVLKAFDGQTGLSILQKETPDMILLDISLPKMSGIQIIDILKKEYNIQFPVIAVTSSVMKDDKSILIKHGFDAIIPKPINTREILVIISHYLKGKK